MDFRIKFYNQQGQLTRQTLALHPYEWCQRRLKMLGFKDEEHYFARPEFRAEKYSHATKRGEFAAIIAMNGLPF